MLGNQGRKDWGMWNRIGFMPGMEDELRRPRMLLVKAKVRK
jgi:hypothetical protein